MTRWETFKKYVFGTPISRAAGVALTPLVGSMLGGWWIADLSAEGQGVDWKKWSDTWATPAILIFIIALIIYSSLTYIYASIQNPWGDPRLLKAKLTEDLYPVWLERARKELKEGTPLRDLEKELIPDD